MILFGSAPPKTKKGEDRVLNPKLLSKPILGANSRAVLMAMKKHTYNRGKEKEKLDLHHLLLLSLPPPSTGGGVPLPYVV